MAHHRRLAVFGQLLLVTGGVSLISMLVFGAAARQPVQIVSQTIKPTYPPTAIFASVQHRAAAPRSSLSRPVLGAVVNHHLVAADFIAETLERAQRVNIDRILLLAPNHFYAGHGSFITTTSDFVTPFGVVKSDGQLAMSVFSDGGLTNDDEPFVGEHGIFNILPFLKKQFPGAPVVPIITRDTTTVQQVHRFAERLETIMTSRTLVIASLDFAHGQTYQGAIVSDTAAVAALVPLNAESAAALNANGSIAVDSPPTLQLFLELMRIRGGRTFTLVKHSNSAEETGQLDATDVTSHITGIVRRSW